MLTDAPRGGAAALEAIERACAAGLGAQELIEEAALRIDRVVPSDGLFIAAADPETSLCMGAGVVQGLPEEACQPLWDHEFLVPDYNKFADLAAGPRPVADLHEATGGRPQRSARYREIHTLAGFEAEARAAFTVDGSAWGLAQLNRLGPQRYSEAELGWLERLAPILARGLRSALLSEPATASVERRGPGIVVLDEDGRLVSATPEAEAWLAEVDSTLFSTNSIGVPIPIEAYAYAAAARAGRDGDQPPPPTTRARLRTRTGMWLLLHASFLRDPSGGAGQVALVIEPAKASDVAPLIVEAYQLTQRELDVTRLIARGLKTAEIAERLFLSPHTVRDHVKAVFEKVGVSSRGELVAKVFADHYHDPLAAALTTAEDRLG